MIFITVGTEKFPFDRLARWINCLMTEGFIDEPVIFQSGSCLYQPTGVEVKPLLREADFRNYLQEARLVITHCGDGTLRQLDRATTPYILVPRTVQFEEHVDDHQVELAQALELLGVPVAWSLGDLVRFIASPCCVTQRIFSHAPINQLCHDLEQRVAGESLAGELALSALSSYQ